MRQFKAQLYPRNGFVFKDSDGFAHVAMGWKLLEAKVIDYRKRNNIAAGSPWEEITTQACGSQPDLCFDDVPLKLMAANDWNVKVTGWLAYAAQLKRSGFWPRVHDEEAARRAQICATCPAQRPLQSSCGACVKSIDNLRKALFDGQAPLHQNLGACGMTGECCQTIVHIELPKNHNPDMPAHCWRRP